MRNIFIIGVMVGLLTCNAALCLGGDPAAMLQGKWNIAPNQRLTQGDVEFKADRTYLLKERHHDKTWVTTKGQYRLYPSTNPVRIDLCLGRCGQPGSEWTTRFGIIRFLSNDQAEIETSPDKNHPAGFSGDSTSQYYLKLTRIK